MVLTNKQRKAMFLKLNPPTNLNVQQVRRINKKLFNDNIAIAKARKIEGEKTTVHTNPQDQTFVFGIKDDNIRTLGFVGLKIASGSVFPEPIVRRGK